jgi:hypothetical protein
MKGQREMDREREGGWVGKKSMDQTWQVSVQMQ